ncbi:unnamed protein product [Pleuronectes platessa]|uniref:Uncharacterized protein n=1 Tax=Pleuronectes platessa TaxID=8262 RepID=A0A9N7YV50_PLEPL|nr:unnamed protein product [Pleuronectes platessa]
MHLMSPDVRVCLQSEDVISPRGNNDNGEHPLAREQLFSLVTIQFRRLFEFRGRVSPVPRVVPVKRPRVAVPLVRRVKSLPVKLLARNASVLPTSNGNKQRCLIPSHDRPEPPEPPFFKPQFPNSCAASASSPPSSLCPRSITHM